jgi:hypothetical protein
MRDAGVRIARQRLLRYRPPEKPGARTRRWLLLGLGGWAVWAALLSDHSIAKLLQLRGERDRLENRVTEARRELASAEERMIGDKPTDEQAERILRERHIFAKEGELVYVIGEDSVRAEHEERKAR